MATLTRAQLTLYAQQAGFSGQALSDVVAIALAESGGKTDVVNPNDPNGGSYGVLQINGIHGQPQSCTFDPLCSFQFAYQLSNGGTNFQPWSTYTSGVYKGQLGSNQVTNWYDYTSLHNFRLTYPWATYPVNGVDIPMPQDTPITAIFPGTISKQYVDQSGGVEIIQADNPSQLQGIPYYYFAHLDQFTASQGQHVVPGQEIGLSGGQNAGGTYNASPNTSSGPHIMLGESKTPSIPYTLDTITSDLNPDWLLGYAQQQNAPLTLTTGGKCPGPNDHCTCPPGYSVTKNGIGNPICKNNSFPFDAQSCKECPTSSTDPLTNISNFISSLSQLQGWLSDPVRIIKLVFGVLLIGGAIFLIASPQGQIAQGIMKGARKVGVK